MLIKSMIRIMLMMLMKSMIRILLMMIMVLMKSMIRIMLSTIIPIMMKIQIQKNTIFSKIEYTLKTMCTEGRGYFSAQGD